MRVQLNRITSAKRKDIRLFAALALVLLIILSGGILQWLSSNHGAHEPIPSPLAPAPKTNDHAEFRRIGEPRSAAPQQDEQLEMAWKAPAPAIDPYQDPSLHMQQARLQEANARFQQALLMLHAEQYDEAITALDRFLMLLPKSVDGHINLGYALIGKKLYAEAFAAFDTATTLKPGQANAYYGAAIALEGMGDLEGALSGMRSFLHLTDKQPSQIHVARARSAIWEWESQLGRGPWGSTKGIPPGFTREELQRNDQGVGIKMPILGTQDEKGWSEYEIKYQSKFKLFDD